MEEKVQTIESFNDLTGDQKHLVICDYLESDDYPQAWWDAAHEMLDAGVYSVHLESVEEWFDDLLDAGMTPKFTSGERGLEDFEFESPRIN